jgi:hypothetical protein
MNATPKPHIAILGSGPTGLEAALAAAEAGFPFTVYEAAPEVAGNVRAWGHVRLFTPWDLNVSPRMRRHLPSAPSSATECPTGNELAEKLLAPLAALPAIAPHLRLGTRVVAVGREGLLKHEEIATAERGRRLFRLIVAGPDGRERAETAAIVIDATGTYGNPNHLGDGGIPALGERTAASENGAIRRSIPDFSREAADWAGKTILLAGAGHSAQTAARDLAALAENAPGTRVLWALRSAAPGWGSHDGDPLPARAGLAADAAALASGASPAIETRRGVAVEEISRSDGKLRVVLRNVLSDGSGTEDVLVDKILALTGYVGDNELHRQLQVHECYATCGPIKLSGALLGAAGGDCLTQTSHGIDTLANPEPGFYILGIKSYGRTNTFLMRVGWDQVAEVFGALAG